MHQQPLKEISIPHLLVYACLSFVLKAGGIYVKPGDLCQMWRPDSLLYNTSFMIKRRATPKRTTPKINFIDFDLSL